MAYTYNKWRIKEFAEETSMTISQLGRTVGITNLETVSRWLEGSIPNVKVLARFASENHIPLLEFFSEDGTPMHKLYAKVEQEEKQEAKHIDIANVIPTISHVQEIARLEKEHLRELMQKDIDLAKKEVEMTDRIREKVKAEFEKDKQQIIDSYEARLADRDAIIGKLQQQLAELTVQYKELESTQREKGYLGFGGMMGLAEPNTIRK